MSLPKKDQVFPDNAELKSDAELALLVSEALRADYGTSSAAIKRIARDARVSPRTARNWYEGKNLLSVRCLVLLGRGSLAMHALILHLLQPQQTIDFNLADLPNLKLNPGKPSSAKQLGPNRPINRPINSGLSSRNDRQEWFLAQLRVGTRVTAEDIVGSWIVGMTTAKDDIAKLKASGLVVFIGARRTGRYELAFDSRK